MAPFFFMQAGSSLDPEFHEFPETKAKKSAEAAEVLELFEQLRLAIAERRVVLLGSSRGTEFEPAAAQGHRDRRSPTAHTATPNCRAQ